MEAAVKKNMTKAFDQEWGRREADVAGELGTHK